MIKSILKYTILALFILNLPTFLLFNLSATISSLVSYASFALVAVYYLLFLRTKPNFWLLYLGLGYYGISLLQIYMGTERDSIMLMIKYMILVIGANGVFKDLRMREMLFLLAVGSMSIIVETFFFPSSYGRASGFYINPNSAGFVAAFGFGLSYFLTKKKWKYGYQLFFTLAGYLTFSRTFLVIWLLANLISVRANWRNGIILLSGAAGMVLIILFGQAFDIGGERFEAYGKILTEGRSTEELGEDSRDETWALFYDDIADYPIFGGGFGKFQKGGVNGIAVHNTYLLIIGEAGIFPLIFFLVFWVVLFKRSLRLFNRYPYILILCAIYSIYLLTTHNFFDNYVKLMTLMFLYNIIENKLLSEQATDPDQSNEEFSLDKGIR